jgi:hypothetical protein
MGKPPHLSHIRGVLGIINILITPRIPYTNIDGQPRIPFPTKIIVQIGETYNVVSALGFLFD